ncbi:MAG TPA: alpha/beta hydrolase fold domain-containing protein [Gemmatimonadaceae bacterium]|nr:alpha/beta hydrolase fold domain-containing protein [Gemmatimonadaceae bacterium]
MLAMRTLMALQPAAKPGTEGRAAFDELMEKTPKADGVAYQAASVGGVPGWWCSPVNAVGGQAILYLHGGAYILGSALAHRHFAGQIAARAGAPAFVADYGLAPEHPFPAAIDDGVTVYRALARAGFSRLAIAGDSAGGGLALALASELTEAARDGALPRPAAVVALSPWTDLALEGDSMSAPAMHDPLLTREALEAARHLYLRELDPKDPRASPLYGELTDLPPVLLHVGEHEILLDDSRRYADRAAQSGSPVELHEWQGMVHVFPANLTLLRAAHEALDITGEFLRRNLETFESRSVIPPTPEWRKDMTRILFVGQKPETVDFTDPALPPGTTAEKINAGIAAGVAKVEEHGWRGDTCMITPDAAGNVMLENALKAATYDCVVVGGGLRVPPKSLMLFETVMNIIHKGAPNATIAFNTSPADTADAAARQLGGR